MKVPVYGMQRSAPRCHADALEARDPLASVLVRRAIILSLLRTGKVAADRRAAEHLKSCAASDMLIPDYGGVPDHLSFLEKLRRLFRSRKAFWERIAKVAFERKAT